MDIVFTYSNVQILWGGEEESYLHKGNEVYILVIMNLIASYYIHMVHVS